MLFCRRIANLPDIGVLQFVTTDDLALHFDFDYFGNEVFVA
jgi:hypothetical protein